MRSCRFADVPHLEGIIISLKDNIDGSLSVKLVNGKISRKIEYRSDSVSANVLIQRDFGRPMYVAQ